MDFQSPPDIEQQRKARVEEHRSLYLSTGGASKHGGVERGENLNESNPGIGLIYQWGEKDKKFLMGGKYLNSHNKESYYIGGGYKKRILGNENANISGGVTGGILTGYPAGTMPAIMPTLSADYGNFGIDLMYAPKTEKSHETYMLNGRIKLK